MSSGQEVFPHHNKISSSEPPVGPSTASLVDNEKPRVFISYSRDDLHFADQLLIGLQFAGFAPTLDRSGISGGEEWKTRLGDLIRETDTVVFVLSPSSAVSDICGWEVQEARRLGQRIIPVLCRPLDESSAPKALGELNYIYFYNEQRLPGSGFASGLMLLATALKTDLDWHREHTRILLRAMEWDKGGRPAARLLSGTDIQAAKDWAAKRPRAAAELTELQQTYILASEAEAVALHDAERLRLVEMATAQDAKAKALADREVALIQVADAQRRRAFFRNSLLVAMAAACCISGWSWYTISLGNRQLAKQVRVSEEATLRAQQAQRKAQDSEFDAITNECTASQQLLEANPNDAEKKQNFLSCAVRFAFALIRRKEPTKAKQFLDKAERLVPRREVEANKNVGFYYAVIAEASAVANCAQTSPNTTSRAAALSQLKTSADVVVNVAPASFLEKRWREELFRGFLYLSNFASEDGHYELARTYSLALVARLSSILPPSADRDRDLARALDNLAWTSILTKRYADALASSERALKLAGVLSADDLSSVRLNYAHGLLLTGRVAEAENIYGELSEDAVANDLTKLMAAGICNDTFARFVKTKLICGSK